MTAREFVKSGKHLPRPLRDFHDQKRLFKRIWQNVRNRQKQDAESGSLLPVTLKDSNWIDCHIFVIDFFLWFMALHGYTLQKSRQPIEFYDFDHAMRVFDEEQMQALQARIESVSR